TDRAPVPGSRSACRLRMALHVRAHERTHCDGPQPGGTDVLERSGDELPAEPLALEFRRYLGVDEDDCVGATPVENLSGELAVDAQLVALLGRIVPHRNLRATRGHRSTLAQA